MKKDRREGALRKPGKRWENKFDVTHGTEDKTERHNIGSGSSIAAAGQIDHKKTSRAGDLGKKGR
jgi:hypothetical protein